MKKLKYVLGRIFEVNYKRAWDLVGLIKERTGKNKLIIFLDMIYCSLRYQAAFHDYYCFGMYALDFASRKKILTRGKNNTYVRLLNPKEYWHVFDNKNEFNERFSFYLKRKWLYLYNTSFDEFKKWITDLNVIIAKPNNDSGGKGIEKISVDLDHLAELYEYLMEKKLWLLEEVITQNEVLSRLYPESINTVRIITVLVGDKVSFLTAFLRIGNGSFVDNTSSGGMLTMIDLETGKTKYNACDNDLNVYVYHPMTKEKIAGILIPYFDEVKKLVTELALMEPTVRYIAWDIAIGVDGPIVVEGNPYPGYYYQYPLYHENDDWIVPRFERILHD